MLVYTPQHTNRWTIFSAPLEQRGLDFDGNGPWIKRIRAAKTDTMRNRIECKQEGEGRRRRNRVARSCYFLRAIDPQRSSSTRPARLLIIFSAWSPAKERYVAEGKRASRKRLAAACVNPSISPRLGSFNRRPPRRSSVTKERSPPTHRTHRHRSSIWYAKSPIGQCICIYMYTIAPFYAIVSRSLAI